MHIFQRDYGDTSKTFLWNTLIVVLHSKRQIVLTVASNGNASLSLSGGRITHSKFKISIQIIETSIYNRQRIELVELLKLTNLIIWDEALMTHKFFFKDLL